MFYPNVTRTVREAIQAHDAEVVATECSPLPKGTPAPLWHVLWMCDQIEAFDTTTCESAVKAGRWIGYISCAMETHGFWNNQYSRDITRVDVHNGHDVPH